MMSLWLKKAIIIISLKINITSANNIGTVYFLLEKYIKKTILLLLLYSYEINIIKYEQEGYRDYFDISAGRFGTGHWRLLY